MRKPADMLTYRYPRTALDEFGCNADSANPLQHFASRRRLHHVALAWALATAALCALGYLMSR